MSELRKRAKELGVALSRIRKAELIRIVQRTEGNEECFGADWRFDCPRQDCCWRTDCQTKNPG